MEEEKNSNINDGYDLEMAQRWLNENPVPCEGYPRLSPGSRNKMLSEETQQLIEDTRNGMNNVRNIMIEMETCHEKLRQERNELREERNELREEVARLKRIVKSKECFNTPWENRRDITVDEWEQKTLEFIKENLEIGDRFCAPMNRKDTANECLERIQKHGWKHNPQVAYDPRTQWLDLIRDE